jgi:hypothetical protein
MNKNIAIGVDNFKTLREEGSYFIDKSLLIQEVVENAASVLLFPRPRRFGKTLNLSMLEYFFSLENKENNAALFEGLAITKTSVWNEHQGQYPVISITLKNCKGDNFNSIFHKISEVISDLYRKFDFLLDNTSLKEFEKENFDIVLQGKAGVDTLKSSLKLLCEYLYRHYDQKVIILIDEYDTLIHEAYLNGFYDEAIDFLKALLGAALKTNPYLKRGVLTGILRVSKESMFSDLNNLEVFTILNKDYNLFYGFTQAEVDQTLKDYNLEYLSSEVKQWYDGYYFGDVEIYNPWSILNFIKRKGELMPYWLNTSSNNLVHSLILKADEDVKKAVEDLINEKEVIGVIEENISFRYLESSMTSVMSFLVHTGYLKAKFHEQIEARRYYFLQIPNMEVKVLYENIIVKWFEENRSSKELREMLKAILSGDMPTFEKIFSKFVLETLSYFSVGGRSHEVERVYQAFMLGMLINLRDTHDVSSEKESGYGRYDIAVIPKDKKQQALLMELKTIDTFHGETVDETLESAMAQIEERKYETALRQQACTKIMKIAVTFDGKRIWTKVKSGGA